MEIKKLKDFYSLFQQQKKEITLLIFLSIFGMFFEALSIAIVFPFLEIIFEGTSRFEKYDYFNFLKYLNSENYIFVITGFMLFIFTIKAIFLTYFAKKRVQFVHEIRTYHANSLFKSYLHSPLSFHLENNSASLIRNLHDSALLSAMARGIIDVFSEFLVLFGIVALLLFVNPFISGLVISIFGLAGLVFYRIIRTKANDWGEKSKYFRGIKLLNLKESFGAIREIKILGKEKIILDTFSKNNYLENFYTSLHGFVTSLPRVWFEWLTILVVIFLVFFFSRSSVDKSTVIPLLGVFAVSSYRLIPSIVRIVNGAQEIKYCYPTAIPYLNSMELLKNIEDEEKKHVIKKIKFDSLVSLKNINFNYNKSDKLILEGTSLDIKKGKFIGIYGESGSGKTTLINILLGLHNPNSGKIFVDDFDVSKDIRNWQRLISYIPQNVYITDDTILKNVAFGEEKENIDITRVNDCLKKSNIYEFIYSIKNNINSIFGEFGGKLSGGQRQRLAIARALYNDSEILVFDEFTSFLDKKNELEIIKEINNMKNKTRIMITHNEKVLDYCDEVYELKDKKISIKK